MDTLVVASTAQDSAAVEAVRQHHAQMAGALAAHVSRVVEAADDAAALAARDDLVRVGPARPRPARRGGGVGACTRWPTPRAGAPPRRGDARRAPAHRRAGADPEPDHGPRPRRRGGACARGDLRQPPRQGERPDPPAPGRRPGRVARRGARGHARPARRSRGPPRTPRRRLPGRAPGGRLVRGGACACGESDGPELPELDARTVPHAIRHATIFGALDAVGPAGGLVLVAAARPPAAPAPARGPRRPAPSPSTTSSAARRPGACSSCAHRRLTAGQRPRRARRPILGRVPEPDRRPPSPWARRPRPLRYPEQLPVVERRDDILAALREHQVVVIAGETGSGKTTQIPKMCLELGRGGTGQIGHTQPRRIAARSVAERIAEEMEVELGELVGYQVRFTDHSSDRTRVKVMTDGILLAEMQRDRDLRRYDTIIIDEAHERSLNIDFILGYLKSLLPRRPDLKVVITSATIDPARFARHFSTDARGNVVREVPVIEVSGRTYPVEVRYRPLVERAEGGEVTEERDQVTAVCDAVEELWTETPPGHTRHRHPRVLLRGARDPRRRRRARPRMNLPRHRDPPALRPALRRRAAPRLPPGERAPDHPRHQRRRDLADRPRHRLRHRHRHRAHLALLPAHQGPAPAHRAHLAGQRCPALRPLRPRRRRHRGPALLGGGLRDPRPSSPSPRSCAPRSPRSSSR